MNMQNSELDIIEIVEGDTKILVPKKAITAKAPPTEPAFFNPKAKMNRDLSIIAYSVFLKDFKGPKIFLDCLSSLGARGLRVANELELERIVINDLNPSALELAKRSAQLNNLKNFDISEKEACRFCSDFSKKDKRASIVDIDPFGSPARFIDCAIRATMHTGILSVTATDLQVLNGLFQNACMRRYGGVPARTEYGNETAIRLVLGCIRHIAARMDIEIIPLFSESDMHYYRVYLKILNRPDQTENIGYILHCKNCGSRKTTTIKNHKETCDVCHFKAELAGPLWIAELFDKEFVKKMYLEAENKKADKKCIKILAKAVLESQMLLPAYYTIDEIASRIKASPIKLDKVIDRLVKKGFKATVTSFNPTGFKTDAPIKEIESVFQLV